MKYRLSWCATITSWKETSRILHFLRWRTEVFKCSWLKPNLVRRIQRRHLLVSTQTKVSIVEWSLHPDIFVKTDDDDDATAVFGRLEGIWKSTICSVDTKVRLYESITLSAHLYGAETWPRPPSWLGNAVCTVMFILTDATQPIPPAIVLCNCNHLFYKWNNNSLTVLVWMLFCPPVFGHNLIIRPLVSLATVLACPRRNN